MVGKPTKIIQWLFNQDKDKLFEIKEYREKRRLNANNYFWKLLQEICDLKSLDPIEDYKRRVRELGIFRRFMVEIKNIDTFKIMWGNQGEAWFCEEFDTVYVGDTEFKEIHAYYGSSSYNTKQMSRLIDGLVQDCKAVGIETKTKKEIQSLLDSWEGNK